MIAVKPLCNSFWNKMSSLTVSKAGFLINFLYNLFLVIADLLRPGVNQGFLNLLTFFVCILTKGKHLLNIVLKDNTNDWYARLTSWWVYTLSHGTLPISSSNRSMFLLLKSKDFSLFWCRTEVIEVKLNIGKWSDIWEYRTLDFNTLVRELVNISSIRIADEEVNLVGLVIRGYREFAYSIFRKSVVSEWNSLLNKLILKSPRRKHTSWLILSKTQARLELKFLMFVSGGFATYTDTFAIKNITGGYFKEQRVNVITFRTKSDIISMLILKFIM